VFSSGPEATSDISIAYEPPRWIAAFRALALLAFLLAAVIGRPRRRAPLDV